MIQRGIAIIEMMIVLVIIGIFVAAAYPMISGKTVHEGFRETKCVAGYTFTNTRNPNQILDHQGKGIPCSNPQ